MPFYVNSSTVGVDLNSSSTSAQFALGTRVNGSQNSLWVYCIANGAVSAGDCVSVTVDGTASRATTAGPRTSTTEVAFAQNAFADQEYGWFAMNGLNMTIAVSASTSSGAALYIATTSGKLSNTSASATIAGVVLVTTTATVTTTTTTGNLTWPRVIVNNG